MAQELGIREGEPLPRATQLETELGLILKSAFPVFSLLSQPESPRSQFLGAPAMWVG